MGLAANKRRSYGASETNPGLITTIQAKKQQQPNDEKILPINVTPLSPGIEILDMPLVYVTFNIDSKNTITKHNQSKINQMATAPDYQKLKMLRDIAGTRAYKEAGAEDRRGSSSLSAPSCFTPCCRPWSSWTKTELDNLINTQDITTQGTNKQNKQTNKRFIISHVAKVCANKE